MKNMILSLMTLIVLSCNGQTTGSVTISKLPIRIDPMTYSKPQLTTVNGVTVLKFNMNEMGLPVNDATKNALDLKADKQLLSETIIQLKDVQTANASIQTMVTAIQTKYVALNTIVTSLQAKVNAIPTPSPINLTDFNSVKTTVSTLQNDLSSVKASQLLIIKQLTDNIKILTDSIATLNLAFKKLPDLYISGFNGAIGDSGNPIKNGPIEYTKNQRLSIVSPKPWLMVIQTDGDDAGLWLFDPRTGWKLK